MAGGAPGGVYHAMARRYRARLAPEGIAVEIVSTLGAVENLALLRDVPRRIDVELIGFDHLDAYRMVFPFLSAVTLPAGAISLANDVPARDAPVSAPSACRSPMPSRTTICVSTSMHIDFVRSLPR